MDEPMVDNCHYMVSEDSKQHCPFCGSVLEEPKSEKSIREKIKEFFMGD